MSFYKNETRTAPVEMIRSFFFLIAVCCSILFLFPIKSFAEKSDEQGVVLPDAGEQEQVDALVFSADIYHKHTGSSGGGGCYSVRRSGTTTTEVDCGGSMIYYPAQDESKCDRCYAGYSGDHSYRKCWHSKTVTTSYTYYDLGCGKSPSTLLGTVHVIQSTADWTKKLTLTAAYEATEALAVSENSFIWNGGDAVADSIYEVVGNGDYTLQLNADDNANTAAAIITIPIRNIDVTAPVIHTHTLEPDMDWTKEGVLVTITETSDLQPDGSEGCGLHESPYSYDNGETWTADNTYFYKENGVHTILVRDRLENISSYEVSFFNVDNTPPTIVAAEYDDTKNIRSTMLSVSANDLQPDGSEGCGLHEVPYSFDGGVTWVEEPTKEIDTNGIFTVAVRDKLENTVTSEINISNIDCYGPTVNFNMVHDSWTNQDVSLYLHAQDKNADGSDGIGLEHNWCSLDGGRTWKNEEVLVYENNQDVHIIARDKHNNRTNMDISIRQIDKDLPWVSLRMETVGEGKDMQVVLTAYGGDDYSGLPEDAYSWDKGASYGREQTMAVTENGLYQVRVRDKAGNWNCDNIEVDVFQKEEIKIPVIKEKPPIAIEEETTQEEKIEEELPTPVIRKAKKLEEEVKMQEITVVTEEGWGMQEWLCFLLLMLITAMLLLLLLLMLLRTVAVFAENDKGNMQFIGIQWIHHKDERYEVHFSELLLEQCVTTHFLLHPGPLFTVLHKEEQISCLFPEDICIVLTVKKEMDFSLL